MSLHQPLNQPQRAVAIDLAEQNVNPSRWLIWTSALNLFIFLWLILNLIALPNPPALLVNEKLAWYITRASGVVAYLLLSASTMWGLLLSSKVIKEWMPAPVSLAMHNYLAWTALGFVGLHAFALLFDGYYTYTIANLLIPFTGPYEPGWVGIGIIGFYMMLLTSLSFYCRQRIGQKSWRRLHYLTFGIYGLATLHGWQAGTDGAQLAPVYWGSLLLVVFLTLYRIMDALNHK